jgi:hypothetical protein
MSLRIKAKLNSFFQLGTMKARLSMGFLFLALSGTRQASEASGREFLAAFFAILSFTALSFSAARASATTARSYAFFADASCFSAARWSFVAVASGLRVRFFAADLRALFFATALRVSFLAVTLRTVFFAAAFRGDFFAAPLRAAFFAVFLTAINFSFRLIIRQTFCPLPVISSRNR